MGIPLLLKRGMNEPRGKRGKKGKEKPHTGKDTRVTDLAYSGLFFFS